MSDNKRRNTPSSIYVECTHTFFAGGNSGIRRVARNIANFGPQVSLPGAEIKPVVWVGAAFFSPSRRLGEKSHWLFRLSRYSGRLWSRYPGRLMSVFARSLPVSIRGLLRRLKQRVLVRVKTNVGFNLRYYLLGMFSFPGGLLFGKRVRFRPGDTVVLLDSTWSSPPMREYLVNARRDRGIYLGVLLHDLFPLTLAETCEQQTVEGFTAWFKHIVSHMDYFVTNSEATRSTLQAYLQENPALRPYPYRAASFTLGAELDLQSDGAPSEEAMAIWDSPGTALLSLGTIEPRKNHQLLLDAFDLLCARNSPVTLIIVGRYGWKSDEIMQRIDSHAELGKRLIHLADASDADVREALARAGCMVCCSLDEGFGLPIVEGLVHGLKVFASDIPVFREVGGDACSYFPLGEPEALAAMLARWIDKYQRGEHRAESFDWPCWKESTEQFGAVVLSLMSTCRQR